VRRERKKKQGGALQRCTLLKAARGSGRGLRGGGNGGRERPVETAGEAMSMGKAAVATI
jgi:hypothetical protein